MSDELLRLLEEAKKNPKEDIIITLLGLTEKIMVFISAIDSHITFLSKKVDALELRILQTKSDISITTSPLLPPPPPPPSKTPKYEDNTKLAIINELKEFFKKKEQL